MKGQVWLEDLFYSVKKSDTLRIDSSYWLLGSDWERIYTKKDALHLHTCMQNSYKTATKTQEYYLFMHTSVLFKIIFQSKKPPKTLTSNLPQDRFLKIKALSPLSVLLVDTLLIKMEMMSLFSSNWCLRGSRPWSPCWLWFHTQFATSVTMTSPMTGVLSKPWS